MKGFLQKASVKCDLSLFTRVSFNALNLVLISSQISISAPLENGLPLKL